MYSKEIRKRIFEEEIERLESKDLISEEEKRSLLSKYSSYFTELQRVENERTVKARGDAVQKERELILKKRALEEERKKRLQKSPEQIRERNITWMLVLGTLLLLLGGLVLATNNWDEMTPLLKTLSIGFVSGLFYSLHLFTGKKLKIDKTAFAFLTLGSLFIPITIISAGYFELFGHWFSLSGTGKYLYLAIGLAITLPVYFRHGMSTQARFYVWLSYISLSLAVAFFIASFYPSKDVFYLGLLLFNVVLLVVHRKVKDKKNLFTKDLPLYAQGNIALSTLLLLTVFYKEDALFGMNVILTAMIYLFVLFASKRHESHYVFTALFIYGAYMVIENTVLEVIDLALFASIGFIFIGLANKQKDDNLKKLLNYTSAFVSFCSFLFVTGKAIVLFDEQTTLLLAISYLLLSINYGYLAHVLKKDIFNYTAVFFLTLAGVQLLWQLDKVITLHVTPIGYVILGGLLYFVLYVTKRWKYFLPFKMPALVFSLLSMIYGMYTLNIAGYWLLLLSSFLFFAYVTYKISTVYVKVKSIFTTISALSIYLALLVLYPLFIENFISYTNSVTFSGHLAFVAIIGVVVSEFFKKMNVEDLKHSLNWLGLMLYFISIILLLENILINDLMIPIYFAVGTFLLARMGQITKLKVFYYLSGFAFAVGYVFLMNFNFNLSIANGLTYFIVGPIVLLVAARIYRKEYDIISQLFTFAIFAVGLTAIDNTLLFLIIAMIFVYYFNNLKNAFVKTFYLYVSFSMLPIIAYSVKMKFDMMDNFFTVPFIFFVSSIAFVLISYYLRDWKRLALFYSTVFSIIGLTVFVLYPLQATFFTTFLLFLYIVLTIGVSIYAKLGLILVIPLLVFIKFAEQLSDLYSFTVSHDLLIYSITFIAVTLTGQKLYKTLFAKNFLDMFAVSGLIYLGLMFYIVHFYELHILLELIPSFLFVYYLYSQINRVDGLSRKFAKTITYVSLLLPYYKVLSFLNVPTLLEVEVIVLPWIILLIFFSMRTWKNREKEMNILQWFGLIITSGLIVQDALDSNTIYDAFIIGVLSLSAILYGFSMKLKSYFLVGSIVLVLTILIQTKPFWGNMPWWIYLIAAGSLLIGVGSYHEWKKQKGDTETEPKWRILWKKWN